VKQEENPDMAVLIQPCNRLSGAVTWIKLYNRFGGINQPRLSWYAKLLPITGVNHAYRFNTVFVLGIHNSI
jgi:hypothetical protein